MRINNPGATSTPTPIPSVKGRRGIRERDNNSIQSPIELTGEFWNEYDINSRSNESPPHRSTSRSPRASPLQRHKFQQGGEQLVATSSSGSEHNSSDDSSTESANNENDRQLEGSGYPSKGIGIFGVTIAALLLGLYFSSGNSPQCLDECNLLTTENLTDIFKSIEKESNKQEEDFWRNIKVAIQEVSMFDQPRSIIFVYEDKTKETVDNILRNVSGIATCYLRECLNTPVIIDGSSLNTSEVMNDYGIIISRYRKTLETNGVMIVRNLEKVPGISAQAFHSFCDEYNPVVHKALILFTIRVEKLPQGYLTGFIEKMLLDLWKDIGKDEKFYPLFTRISGTVLPVNPE